MRKIDIRDRIHEMERQLVSRKATLSGQADERERLIEACRVAGDHVLEYVVIGNDFVQACEFCHLLGGASPERLSRNLTVG